MPVTLVFNSVSDESYSEILSVVSDIQSMEFSRPEYWSG